MNTLMMRCVVILSFLAVAAPGRAETALQLDEGLLQDVEATVLRASGLGHFVQDSPPPPARKSSGGGGGGGRNLPPQLSGVGLGLQVGSPTAITIKFGGVQETGFVLGVGAGFRYGNRFANDFGLSIHADYLIHVATLVRAEQLALTAYLGPGLWLSLFNDGYYFGNTLGYAPFIDFFGLGIRLPIGLSLGFNAAPVEVYLELDPTLFVFPRIGFGIGASLGFRWHF